jgi:hypothetical protein
VTVSVWSVRLAWRGVKVPVSPAALCGGGSTEMQEVNATASGCKTFPRQASSKIWI